MIINHVLRSSRFAVLFFHKNSTIDVFQMIIYTQGSIQKVLQISQSKVLSKCLNISLKLPKVDVNVRLIWTFLQF
jgi:hypothetical protein